MGTSTHRGLLHICCKALGAINKSMSVVQYLCCHSYHPWVLKTRSSTTVRTEMDKCQHMDSHVWLKTKSQWWTIDSLEPKLNLTCIRCKWRVTPKQQVSNNPLDLVQSYKRNVLTGRSNLIARLPSRTWTQSMTLQVRFQELLGASGQA